MRLLLAAAALALAAVPVAANADPLACVTVRHSKGTSTTACTPYSMSGTMSCTTVSTWPAVMAVPQVVVCTLV
jgi:hypothetical protein